MTHLGVARDLAQLLCDPTGNLCGIERPSGSNINQNSKVDEAQMGFRYFCDSHHNDP